MAGPFDDPELQLLNSADYIIHGQPGSSRLHHELSNSPLFTHAALTQSPQVFPQRGLLGCVLKQEGTGFPSVPEDKRLYVNTSTPCSAVVCGVQGSGKSHTVSCLLECSLIPDKRIGNLPEPLAGIVFHFDEDNGNRPCEAAFLSVPRQEGDRSCAVPEVTVLVSPSNLCTRKKIYATLPNVKVEPLHLSEANLNAARMLSLMGCDDVETMPLYMHAALSVLRQMGSDDFDYTTFKTSLQKCESNGVQRSMFSMRTSLLDSYLSNTARNITSWFGQGKLVIVDLSDPFLDATSAAILFDIMLGIFVEWQTSSRHNKKIIVLDEAHKYLGTTVGSRLTKTIAALIRQQRHLGLRLIISTQEPTVIPATILDLSSYIICHRFSAPSWCTYLKRHVTLLEDHASSWMEQVMRLHAGEALVFSANAVAVQAHSPDEGNGVVARLGAGFLKIITRPRITLDGGYSVMAVNLESPLLSPSLGTEPSLPSPPEPDIRNAEGSCPGIPLSIGGPSCPTPPITPDPGEMREGRTDDDLIEVRDALTSQAGQSHPSHNFQELIEILRESQAVGGMARMSVLQLPPKLLQARPNIYRETGFGRWKRYIAQAEVQGIVKLEAGDIVSLALDAKCQNAPLTSGASSSETRVDRHFDELIGILRQSKKSGVDRLDSNTLSQRLLKAKPMIYRDTGFQSWKEYSIRALLTGLVKVEDKRFYRLASEAEIRLDRSGSSERNLFRELFAILEGMQALGTRKLRRVVVIQELQKFSLSPSQRTGFENWSDYIDAAGAGRYVKLTGEGSSQSVSL